MITIQGKGVSAGVGVGPLYFTAVPRRRSSATRRRIPTPSGTASRVRRPAQSSSWACWPSRPARRPATKRHAV